MKLYFYILFSVASRDIYIETINIINICINIFRKFEDIDTIIVFVNTIDSLYIDKNSNNS